MGLKSLPQIWHCSLTASFSLTSPLSSFHSSNDNLPGLGRGTPRGAEFSEGTVSTPSQGEPHRQDRYSLLSAFYTEVPPVCKYPLRSQGRNKAPAHLNSGSSSGLKRSPGVVTLICSKMNPLWTLLFVLSAPRESESHPKVFPLVSCVSSPSDENTVALGCLARDFVPNSVSFSWKFNNSTVSSEKFWTFPEVLRDGLWSASSQVALHSSSAFQGTDGYLVCEVQHPKGGKPVGTVMVVAPKAEVLSPVVSVFVPPCNSLSGNGNSKSSLICQATDFSPKQISLSWFRDGKRIVSDISEGQVETVQSSPITYRAYSMLTITEREWLSQSAYTCQVEHNKETFQKNASSSCDATPPSPIGVFTIPPSFADIFLTKSAKLSCLVTNLASYDGLNISWSHQNGKALETHTYFERHLNDTFSARGEASVCSEDWESGEEYTCTVAHLDLPFPEKSTISKPKDISIKEPQVSLDVAGNKIDLPIDIPKKFSHC
uniref:Ig mu chain C region n=1 Tax=Capra hircus TaxID=9925 RepID=A0A452EPC6_CAPHI